MNWPSPVIPWARFGHLTAIVALACLYSGGRHYRMTRFTTSDMQSLDALLSSHRRYVEIMERHSGFTIIICTRHPIWTLPSGHRCSFTITPDRWQGFPMTSALEIKMCCGSCHRPLRCWKKDDGQRCEASEILSFTSLVRSGPAPCGRRKSEACPSASNADSAAETPSASCRCVV